ncbi:MAG: hypothetical protein JWL77_2943 [Chthonomonadaceae bacterium]|nr:hypothetical protein [Chthonomonadaceae bacterium]
MILGSILHSRRNALWIAAVGLVGLVTAGCGSGSSQNSRTAAPTALTRTRLASLQNQQLRALSQSGVQPASLAAARNGAFATTSTLLVGASPIGVGAGGGGASAGSSGTQVGALPLIGAFITNVASVRPTTAATAASASRAAHRTRVRRHTRADGTDPNFYFDDYLGLWVEIQDTATSSAFLLYLDEAKTQPAGSFQTTFSASDAFPQTYESHYTITAGALQGTHGDYMTVQNADNSGSSTYNDTYLDGWSDQGKSLWNADGSSTWSSRNDGPNHAFYSYQGSFKADGSGTNHTESSDSYVTDYLYNADGSGSGRIQGPDPGLPATITWDIYGNTTIHYADGSIEYDPGWGFYGGALVAVSGTATGTGSSGGTTGTAQ